MRGIKVYIQTATGWVETMVYERTKRAAEKLASSLYYIPERFCYAV